MTFTPEQRRKKELLNTLNEQIQIKEYKKKLEKLINLEEDQRMLKEQQEYQYFGRGGGGGVKKDYLGRPIVARKSDPRYAANLYGRESNNQHVRRTFGTVVDYSGMDKAEMKAIKNYNMIILEKELEKQKDLKEKLKNEQEKRRALELKIMERKLKREKWELEYVKDQENSHNKTNINSIEFSSKKINRKRTSLQSGVTNNKLIIQPDFKLEKPIICSRQNNLCKALTQDNNNKHSLDQSSEEEGGIRNQIAEIMREEFGKLATTVKNNDLLNSIQELKVH